MVATARPSNELTGIKKRSSVLVRGFSAMEIAKQAGIIPGYYNEAQFIASLIGPRGYSDFDLWKTIAGNENKTLDDYWTFLGLTQGIAVGTTLAQINAAAAATAADRVATGNDRTATHADKLSADGDATAAAGSAAAASGSATAAAGSAAAANTSAADAAASAASIGLFSKATVAELRTQTEDSHYATAKGLSDTMAWVPAAGGEITTPGGVRTVTFNLKSGFNRSDTLSANTTYAAPTNAVDGQGYQFLFIEDATGGWVATLNAIFVFGAVAKDFVTGANKFNLISATYHAGLNKFIVSNWKGA